MRPHLGEVPLPIDCALLYSATLCEPDSAHSAPKPGTLGLALSSLALAVGLGTVDGRGKEKDEKGRT